MTATNRMENNTMKRKKIDEDGIPSMLTLAEEPYELPKQEGD